MRTMMIKNPLLEMAGEYEFIVSLKRRHPAMKAHNPEYSRNARILRAAAAVISAAQAWMNVWGNDAAEVMALDAALTEYEAACKEEPK